MIHFFMYRDTQQQLFNAMGSMYAAVLFIGITNATAAQPVVSIERFVSYRERAAGMYSALPFAFAQVTHMFILFLSFSSSPLWTFKNSKMVKVCMILQVFIEFPYVLAQSTIYSSIFYAMAAFEWSVVKFLWYLFFMYFSIMYFTFYGMMTTAITPNHNVASIIAAPFYMLWNLFSGFMIPYKVHY